MAKTKRMILGVLLTLGMMLGISVTVYAKEYSSLSIGDVIQLGDTIRSADDIKFESITSACSLAVNTTTTLIRADIQDSQINQIWPSGVTEKEDGKYYVLKSIGTDNQTVLYINIKPNEVTSTSDGLFVVSEGNMGLRLAVHETAYMGKVYKEGDTFTVFRNCHYKVPHGTDDDNRMWGYSPSYIVGEFVLNGNIWNVTVSMTSSAESFNIGFSGDKAPIGFEITGSGTSIDPYYFKAVYPAVPHNHQYSTIWSRNSLKHWHDCISTEGICDAPRSDEAAHNYGTTGSARFTCTVCGYVDTAKKSEAEAADKAAGDKDSGGKTDPGKTAEESQEEITITTAPKSVRAKAKKNKVTVTWKKIKKNKKGKALLRQIKTIEVQYSTDPGFPKETAVTKSVRKNKTKAVLKLQRKTTYYVRVRYRGSDGVSAWSKVRRVKTK